MSGALGGVDDVDWDRLRHAYGPASDVPDDLRALVSADAAVRQGALYRLNGSIVHQGSVYSASEKAVPFLIGLLSETEDGAAVVALLRELALGDDLNVFPFGAVPYGRNAERRKDRSRGLRVYRAVERGVPIFCELAVGPDDEVRREATYLLGWLGDAAATSLPVLREQLGREDDGIARGSIRLALGLLGLYRENTEDAALIAEGLTTDGPERFAAAVALAYLSGADAPAATGEALATWAKAGRDPRLPWGSGDVARVADHALRHMAPEDAEARLEYAVERLEDKPIFERARDVLLSVFEESRPPRIPMPEDLSELQRRAIAAVLDSPFMTDGEHRLLTRFGLPRHAATNRRRLGLDPPTVMERTLPIDGASGSYDVWRACKLLSRRGLDPDRVGAALVSSLEADEVLDVAVSLASDEDFQPDAGLSGELDDAAVRMTAIAVDWIDRAGPSLDALERVSTSLADAPFSERDVFNQTGPGVHRAATAVAVSLVRRYEATQTPAKRLDGLFARVRNAHRELEREVFAAIPEARREQLVLARNADDHGRERRAEGTRRYAFEARGAWWLYDLCPTSAVADRVVAHVCGRSRGIWDIEDHVVATLVGFGEVALPRIVAALESKKKAARRDLLYRALGEIGDTRGVEPLVAALADKSTIVVEAVTTAVRKLPPDSVRPALEALAAKRRGKVRTLAESLLAELD